MLKIIADQSAIKKYNHQFVKKFKPFIDEQIKVRLGHQGASFKAKVLWSKKLGIWIFSQVIKEVRYWNAFGTGSLQPGELLSIAAEINFPWSGIDRKTGAAFARDAWGNIFVIHRGKIGGGKKGIGKSLFNQRYRGVWSFMEDGDGVTQVAVIGALNSPRLTQQTAQFVRKIEILKATAAASAQMEISFPEMTFREDLVGDLPSLEEPDISCRCDRDLLISNLAALLVRSKFIVGNDSSHELFLTDPLKNRKSHVFEVLISTGEENILAAAAKLLLQKTSEQDHPDPVMILPEDKMVVWARKMQKIGITTIGFSLEDDRIIFPDLGKIRLDQNPQL